MASGIASSIRGIMSTLGVVSGAAVFVGLIRSGEDFNRKMRSSLAIMGEVSTALRVDMRNAAFEAARATQFSAAQAAEAYFFLASAGLSAEQSIASMSQVAAFAQAGMFSLSRATDLATDAQSALGLTVKDPTKNLENLTHVTDVLVKANTLANASVEQFATAMTSKAAAAAKIVGKDIEELTAVLAAFADQGVKSQAAGNAINIILRDLQSASIKNRSTFEKYGVTVFDVTGKMRNMADIIGELEKALKPMTDEQKKATLAQLGFADRSVIFLQTLIGTSEKIREYEKELRKAGGTTRDVASKQLTPMQKGMAKLGATITKISSLISKVIGPVVEIFGKYSKVIILVVGAIVLLKAETILATFATIAFKALMGPAGWASIAVGIGVATIAIAEMKELLGDAADEMKRLTEETKNLTEEISKSEPGQSGVRFGPSQNVGPLPFEKKVPAVSGPKEFFDLLEKEGPKAPLFVSSPKEFFDLLGKREKPKVDLTKPAPSSIFIAPEGPQTEAEKSQLEMLRNIREEADRLRAGGPLGEFLQLNIIQTPAKVNQFIKALREIRSIRADKTIGELRAQIKGMSENLTPAEIKFRAFVRSNGQLDPNKARELRKAFKDMGIEQARVSLKEYIASVDDLISGLSDVEKRTREWARANRDASEEDIKRFRRAAKAEADFRKKESLETKAKELAKSIHTPLEIYTDKIKEIRDLMKEFPKIITPEIGKRLTKAARKEALGDRAQPAIEGRFGLVDFGKQIQDALLKGDKDRIQKDILKEEKKNNEVGRKDVVSAIDKINIGLA